MRTQLELWKIIDEHFDDFFVTGLCSVLTRCYLDSIINYDEFKMIESEFSEYGDDTYYFLGDEGDPKPRKKFIKKMIDKHSKINIMIRKLNSYEVRGFSPEDVLRKKLNEVIEEVNRLKEEIEELKREVKK